MKRFIILLAFALIASSYNSFSIDFRLVKGTNPNGNYGYLAGTGYGAYGSNTIGNFGYLGGEEFAVYGYYNSSGNYGGLGYSSAGVYGYSYIGNGIYGESTLGLAGYFVGDVWITSQLSVGTAPSGSYGITLPSTSTVTDNSGCGIGYGWHIYSDNRLKSNQQPLSYGLPEIMRLKPKEYEQHSSKTIDNKLSILKEHSKSIGLIAQELHQVIPEAAFPPENEEKDLWAVDYTKLVPVLIKAMQEQQTQIETQQQQINQLINKIKLLEGDCDKPAINVK
jgi:hypothetical protein